MALFTWKRLTNTAPNLAGAEDGTTAFSGAAYDPNRRYFIFNGGGHLDGSDNGVYAVRVGRDTPDVIALMRGSASAQMDVAYYSDGKPSSRHTYGTLIYVPALDGLFQFGCAAAYGSGNFRDGTVNRFNLATNAWDPAGTYGSMPASTADYDMFTCRDDSGNVYQTSIRSASILKWTPGRPGSWSTFWNDGGVGVGSDALAFDSNRQRIVHFSAGGKQAWWSLAGVRTGITFSGPSAAKAAQGSWLYCPDRDSFIGVVGGTTTVLECNAGTYSVSALPIAGTPPSVGAAGFYNRWQIDPSLGAVFFHASWGSTDLWVFRYK